MTSTIEANLNLIFLSLTFIMGCIWWRQWKLFCLDKLRQELYLIRYQLFSDAMGDEFDFDFNNKGYGYLRTHIHAIINITRLLSPFRLLVIKFLSWSNDVEIKPRPDPDFAKLDISEKASQRLEELRNRVRAQIGLYMLKTSPIMQLSAVAVVSTVLLRHGIRSVKKGLQAAYGKHVLPTYENVLEFESQRSEPIGEPRPKVA